MTTHERSVARFGDFEFHRKTGPLRKSGVRIRLSKRSALLLDELVSSRGQIVTREQLGRLLWGADTHVDFEDGLNHAIKRVRDALGDDSKSPRFIERVPREGYRFTAEVDYAPSPRRANGRTRRSSRGLALAASIALCLVVGGILLSRRAIFRDQTVAASVPVVTVLPFDNLSEEANGDRLAVGVAEALTDELSKLGGMRVTSRSSALRASGAPSAVALRLGSSYLVSGSILPAGEKARVTVRLTDVAAGSQIWADTYETNTGAPLALWTDLPRQIAAAVRVRVTPEEEARLAAARPVRLDVYETHQNARSAFESGDLDAAVDLFEEAIQLDPEFAPSYAWLANAHLSLGYWARRPNPMLKRAETAALRALRLDPTLAVPHLVLGQALSSFQWRWAKAEEHFRKAIELNPNHVQAYLGYGKYLAIINRTRDAAEMAEQAIRLDPLSASTHAAAGEVFHASRKYGRASELLHTAVTLHPDGTQYQVQLACIYGGAGDFEKAHEYIDRAIHRSGGDLRAQAIQAWLNTQSGAPAKARKLVRELEPSWDPADGSHYARAFLYNAVGERDRAFEILDQCVEDRWPGLATSIFLPPFDPLRDDPRFAAILDRMGLAAIREANARL